jgi:hypothetical protein
VGERFVGIHGKLDIMEKVTVLESPVDESRSLGESLVAQIAQSFKLNQQQQLVYVASIPPTLKWCMII